MISPSAIKLSSGRILVRRFVGASGGEMRPVRRHYGLRGSYILDPANGSAPTTVSFVFPNDKYDALATEPTWAHHRFIGWFDHAGTPSVAGTTSGNTVSSSDLVLYERSAVYAQWQLPTTVTFDATTGGGSMPSGWTAPDYYEGQLFGALPTPTHAALSFGGWYLNGTRVTAATLVPANGAALVAQFVSSAYSVDLNDGDWVLDSSLNPDSSTYDGVYKSQKYWMSPPSEGCAVKMYLDVVGYTTFRVYIRSYAESGWSYVVAMPVDVDPDYIPGEDNGVANTSSESGSSSGTSIDSYKAVDYALDGGQHRICIVYRHGDGYALNDDRGYVLIPKVQGGS